MKAWPHSMARLLRLFVDQESVFPEQTHRGRSCCLQGEQQQSRHEVPRGFQLHVQLVLQQINYLVNVPLESGISLNHKIIKFGKTSKTSLTINPSLLCQVSHVPVRACDLRAENANLCLKFCSCLPKIILNICLNAWKYSVYCISVIHRVSILHFLLVSKVLYTFFRHIICCVSSCDPLSLLNEWGKWRERVMNGYFLSTWIHILYRQNLFLVKHNNTAYIN